MVSILRGVRDIADSSGAVGSACARRDESGANRNAVVSSTALHDILLRMSASDTSGTAILLVNLGTPDAPTPRAVRRYLGEFLMDPRVVALPRWLWAPLLSLVVVGNISYFCSRQIHIIPLVTSVSVAILMLQNSVTTEGRYRKPVEPLILLNVVWLLSLSSTNRKETAINTTPVPQLQ